MPVTIIQHSTLHRPGLAEVIDTYAKELHTPLSDLLKPMNTRYSYETITALSGFDNAVAISELGQVTYDTLVQGPSKNYEPIRWGVAYAISKQAAYTDVYRKLKQPLQAMTASMMEAREASAALLFSGGFSVTTNTRDGVPWFSDSHPLPRSSALGDNKITDALSQAGLENAMVRLRRQVNDANGRMPGLKPMVRYLIVPPELEATALKLMQSTQVVGSANNDINPMKAIANVVVSELFTSTTQWYLLGDQHRAFRLSRLPLELDEDYDMDKGIHKFLLSQEWVDGIADWRYAIGSQA